MRPQAAPDRLDHGLHQQQGLPVDGRFRDRSTVPVGAVPLDVAEANALLTDGDYDVSLTRRDGAVFLDGVGAGVSLGPAPTWSELTRALVRSRRTRRRPNPGRLHDLARALDVSDAGVAPCPPPEWSRFATAVAADPLLRMHCATQPLPAALSHAGPMAAPAPPHPRHPGGTLAITPSGLVRPVTGLPGGLLEQVVGNRFEYREDELAYFLEHFVRPPLRAFRLALERHRTGLLGLHGYGFGFELSPELQATGRIVVTGSARVRDVARTDSADIEWGVHVLLESLDALSAAFARTGNGRADGEVRSGVDRVITEELRDLEPRTADVLSGDHRLRCFVHTVPSSQDDVLKRVLHTVQERTRSRRWDVRQPVPTVVIDLELCGIVPLRRIQDAARAVSGPRPGAPEGITELARPESLPLLPVHTGSTWRNFVEVSGLGEKYPGVDWQRLHAEFSRAFARPSGRLDTDTVNAGLARFVWDVQDAGGRVVFCTGRRERWRAHTEDVLAAEGVPDARLLCMPDDRSRPISELKVERLRELDDVDVVAVFDDMLVNRIAITKEFSAAVAVAVEIPGLAGERRSGQEADDHVPVIATFETSPRRGPARRDSGLSHAHSLEEVQVAALRENRAAERWAVRLTTDESLSVVDSLVADADRAAARTARSARVKFEEDALDERDRTVRMLHHVFTRKQFLKGSRSHYGLDDMHRDASPFLRTSSPVEVVLLGFPIKQCLNRLKASGPLPDLAELGALVRLRELQSAVRSVYPPGLHFNILTDGRHFRSRPASATGAYSRVLRRYLELAGVDGCATVTEIDALAGERSGTDVSAERATRFARYRRLFDDALRGFDITDKPLRTLDSVVTAAFAADGPDADVLARSLGMFREMVMSMVYSVPVPVPRRTDRLAWSRLVYADVYNLTDGGAPPEVRRARAAVLRRAWHNVVRYLATLRVDEELAYDDLFPDRVRLTVNAATPGRCGFTYLGGSGLLPWQGTGVLDERGHVAVDFAVCLLDRGFVPVYSPLIGPRQPWLMVPAQHTRPGAAGTAEHGMHLDESFAARARLRRK